MSDKENDGSICNQPNVRWHPSALGHRVIASTYAIHLLNAALFVISDLRDKDRKNSEHSKYHSVLSYFCVCCFVCLFFACVVLFCFFFSLVFWCLVCFVLCLFGFDMWLIVDYKINVRKKYKNIKKI